jgi:sigma-B regulation protein RsbU (phosphoserine phosphatase)
MAHPVHVFWRRVSDGIEIQQLWAQFRAEARASYQLYSKEVAWTRQEGETGFTRFWRVARGLFWAMMTKLSPARRVVFLVSLIFLFMPRFAWQTGETRIELPDFTFLGGAGLLVLLALELADRVMMKRDLEIAKEIQTWLMPAAAPPVPGVDIAFFTRPANTVAGDYYDAFFRDGCGGSDGRRLLLVVADVAGKSMPAALLMATLQASLRTLSTLPITLTELAGRLNQYTCEQNLGGHRFTTAFLAELDPATGSMAYINAGHNWPVLRRPSGAIERLEIGGLPLGIRPGVPYDCGQTMLGRGDLLLIFTDGLVEAEDEEGHEYSEWRMLKVVEAFPRGNASEVLKGMMTSVDAFVGATRQHDDITCLVLRMTE